jgi:hypothetical protein
MTSYHGAASARWMADSFGASTSQVKGLEKSHVASVDCTDVPPAPSKAPDLKRSRSVVEEVSERKVWMQCVHCVQLRAPCGLRTHPATHCPATSM